MIFKIDGSTKIAYSYKPSLLWRSLVLVSLARFSDPDRSLNRKKKRFKVFEVETRSNRDDVIINLIIN